MPRSRTPLGRVLGGGRAAAALAAGTARAGLDAAGQVRSAASEIARVRRDPSSAALRRHAAAKRRLQAWGAGSVVGLAGSAAAITALITTGLSAATVFYLLLALAVLGYCATGAVRAGRDLRQRGRVVAALPPPQPPRRTVDRSLTPQLTKLGHDSDALRQLIVLVGMTDDAHMRSLRADVIAAADAAEVRLRRLADQLSVLLRARRGGPAAPNAGLEPTVAQLSGELSAGVDQYGRLVAAASDSALASRTAAGPDLALADATGRLSALAVGLRELSNE